MRIQDLGMMKGHRHLRVDLTRDETELASRLLSLVFSGDPIEELLLVDDDGNRIQVLYATVKDLDLDLDEGWAFELVGEMIPLRRES